MTILCYGNCKTCKSQKDTSRDILNKVFPDIIANNIVNYHTCSYCSKMLKDEDKVRAGNELSKIELQLKYFQLIV